MPISRRLPEPPFVPSEPTRTPPEVPASRASNRCTTYVGRTGGADGGALANFLANARRSIPPNLSLRVPAGTVRSVFGLSGSSARTGPLVQIGEDSPLLHLHASESREPTWAEVVAGRSEVDLREHGHVDLLISGSPQQFSREDASYGFYDPLAATGFEFMESPGSEQPVPGFAHHIHFDQAVAELRGGSNGPLRIFDGMRSTWLALDGALYTDSIADAISFWRNFQPPGRDGVPKQVQAASWQLEKRDEANLRRFLRRLRDTHEYKDLRTRPRLASRVNALLDAMEESAHLRGLCCERIEEALESCDDRVIIMMNQLELAIQVYAAESGSLDEVALQRLGFGLLKLEVVHAQARAKCEQLAVEGGSVEGGRVDEVEVFLAFEIKLRESLGLPVSTQNMLYGTEVTDDDLERAKQAALAAVDDPQRRALFFGAWAPWQICERRRALQSFARERLHEQEIALADLEGAVCPLTLEPLTNLTSPLLYRRGVRWRACEGEAFLTWWQAKGTDPELNLPIGLTDLFRPVTESGMKRSNIGAKWPIQRT